MSEEEGTEEYGTIDPITRQITIPEGLKLVGVEGDEDVTRRKFRMPWAYGEVDLSEFEVRINFRNAKGEGDIYLVEDLVKDGEEMTFSWLLSRKAMRYKGDIQFIVCMPLMGDEDDGIQQEWNTTLGAFTVLEGLEVNPIPTQEEADVVAQLLRLAKEAVSDEQIASAVDKYLEENPVESYTLPVATASVLGGVMPVAKTDEMTQAVGVDEAGGLWAVPGKGYAGAFELVKDETITEDVSLIDIDEIGGAENVKLLIRARFNNEANDAANADNIANVLVNQGGKGYQYSGRFGYVRQSGDPVWTYIDIKDFYVGPLIHVYDMGSIGVSSPRSNTSTGAWDEGVGIQRIRIYTANNMLFKANTRIIMLKK